MNERTHLDLFSGIGGFALAAKWNGFRTVGFCDNEPYAQAVLKKHWPDVPCHKDIKELRGQPHAGVTLLTGGFPCQPFSVAGKQRGKADDRYLWPEMLRVIREAQPRWIVGENVAGIVNMALDQVHTDLEAEGYEVESIIIPACSVDASHRRDRVWIVGHAKLNGLITSKTSGGLFDQSEEQGRKIEKREPAGTSCTSSDVANANGRQLSKCESERKSVQMFSEGSERLCDVANAVSQRGCGGNSEGGYAEDVRESSRHSRDNSRGMATWLPEPSVGRVAHGVPNRVAKLRGLGNAIVPQVAAEIIRCIVEVSK